MRYLLDTNVLSENMRVRPDPHVTYWLATVPANACHVSVLTLGEIRAGAQAHPDPARRRKLTAWLEGTLTPWFSNRTLGVDTEVADRWGRICASFSRTLPTVDSLLVATALTHGLTLVTRDKGFRDYEGLETLNPWLKS
jgi:toxin FitB